MSTDFKVIIVGGSVAGLTLAHCLEKLDISFQVLERNDDISPELGASIGILPNGARILDQLGLFKAVEKEVEPMKKARISYKNDFAFPSDFPASWERSFGYPAAFLERRKFLAILFRNLKDKDRVHTGQKVVSIRSEASHVVVKTTAGNEYTASLVVGADGVHSTVRSEMWRHIKEARPGTTTDDETILALKLEFGCIYGISTQVPEVESGVWYNFMDKQLTLHYIGGKGRRVFWFLILKRRIDGETTAMWDLPAGETRRICESLQHKRLSPALTFGDIWSRRGIFKMTPLEEGWFKTWHFDRLVIMGDAIRKMAPTIGQGANMAIEDAAVLANTLWRAGLGNANKYDLSTSGTLSQVKIEKALRHYSASLQARTRYMCGLSEFLVRLQTHDGVVKGIVARYIIPFLGDVPAKMSSKAIRAGPLLEFVEVPTRSCQHTKGQPADSAWIVSKRLLVLVFLACTAAVIPRFILLSGGLDLFKKSLL